MGKIQKQDVKTEAELVTAGASKADLINDTQIYVTASSINKTLDDAIIDGDIGSGGGGSSKFAIVSEAQASGVASTTSLSAGSWVTNVLNDYEGDVAVGSISSNQITLGSGTYVLDITIPFVTNPGSTVVTALQARLRDITNTATVRSSDGFQTRSSGNDIISGVMTMRRTLTLVSSTVYEIQTRVSQTTGVSIGIAPGFSELSVYTQCSITKV